MTATRVPAGATVEIRSLDALKTRGVVADYRLEGSVVHFYLERVTEQTEISYSLSSPQPGTVHHAGASAASMYDPDIHTATVGGDLIVGERD